MRRFIVLLAAAGVASVSAYGQIMPRDADAPPSVTDPSVPFTYVGNDGSISIGLNSEGETEGQLLGVFARRDTHAVVGQLWWDRSGAGGVQGDYNWLWGGNPVAAREHPDQATVSRLSFALDQNAAHDRKATVGFGIERRAFSVEAWLAHGISSGRAAGHALQDTPNQIGGSDDIGAWTQVDTTTIDTLFEEKAFGTEVGLQFSHVFEPMAMRLYGGASTQDGVGARATTLSLGLDTPLGRRGWGLSALAEHVRRTGGAGNSEDDRLSMFVRYEFGGHGSFVPTAQLDSPAWISRSIARPSNAHSRTVESYRKVRSQTVSVNHGQRQYTNHFPLAKPDSAGTSEGNAVSIDVLANDSDADGDALAISAVTAPAHGVATISGGAIVYTPAPGFSGSDTFAYTVSDGRGGSASTNVVVTVGAGANRAPVARDDVATTPFGQAVTIDVLANDVDPDGDALTLLNAGAPAHGSASISGGSIRYTPTPGYSGADAFTYTVSDGHGGTATATVTITVEPQPNRPPVAVDDGVTTPFGQPVTVSVLANDYDPDDDMLTIATVDAPAHGTAMLSGGAIVYTPAPGYSGADAFTYAISDGHGGTATATVTVTVAQQSNRSPVAVDDAVTTPFGQAVTVPVLTNDHDPDGDALTIGTVGAPAHGTAILSGDAIVYTPVPGYSGTDAFTYTISDGRGGTATATVTVTVAQQPNHPPIAVDDAATTPFGQAVTVPVLTNDHDPDGDALTISTVGTPAHGTAVRSGDAIVYTPVPGYSGADAFTYTISDGNGGRATATVSVTVAQQPNRPPVAVDDAVATPFGQAVTVQVLANDHDPDGDALTISTVAAAAHGVATLSGSAIVYTPAPGYSGTDAFAYTISDGRGGTATATVTVTITAAPNQPPVAANDAASVQAGASVTIPVLANDGDPDGDALTITAVSAPNLGTATISGGAIVYTAPAAAAGTTSFTYTISDGRGGTATATVTVTIAAAPNQPPIAVNDAASVSAGASVTVPVLANDSDPDGDALTITAVSAPNLGTATISGGAIAYTAPFGVVGAASFTYTISDGRGGTATATVTVNVVNAPNQPPVAADDTANTTSGQAVSIAVLDNDSDPDGDVLSISAASAPAHGGTAIFGTIVTYTPAIGYVGTDAFTYTVSDGRGGTATATVTVTVAALPNQPPVAADDTATVASGSSVTIPVLANDSDPDNDVLTITVVGTPLAGSATISGGAILYTPFPTGVNGSDTFTYTISDGHGHFATATVTVQIVGVPINQNPVAQNDVAITQYQTPITVDVLANDSDPDGDALTITAVTQPANGTATITSTGILYTPNAGFFGTVDVFTYTVSDGRGGTATAQVGVFVSG